MSFEVRGVVENLVTAVTGVLDFFGVSVVVQFVHAQGRKDHGAPVTHDAVPLRCPCCLLVCLLVPPQTFSIVESGWTSPTYTGLAKLVARLAFVQGVAGHVAVQECFAHEAVSTELAVEGSLATVDTQVHLQRACIDQEFPAQVALVFVSVHCHVVLECAARMEQVSTLLTLEADVLVARPDMVAQVAGAVERSLALSALEQSLRQMGALVQLQAGGSHKAHAAGVTVDEVGLGVQLHVCGQCVQRCQVLTTLLTAVLRLHVFDSVLLQEVYTGKLLETNAAAEGQ